MEFKAYKMDGLGNDFVIIDQRNNRIELSNEQILKICDRSFIGCDQLIIIEQSPFNFLKEEFDPGIIAEINYKLGDHKIKPDNIKNIYNHLTSIYAKLKFYNSDGSSSGACGNGTRCVAYLLSKEINKNEITFWIQNSLAANEIGNPIIPSKILGDNLVETIIGVPQTNWDEIPISKPLDTKNLGIEIKDKKNIVTKGGIGVNVGNPHVIFFVEDIENFELEKIGPKIENHKLFPNKCNVTLAKKVTDNHYKVKVWERGAGLTKACGTAACATAVAANLEKLENTRTEIEFNLGKLLISIDENKNIAMKGPVSKIEEIKINI